MVLEVMIPKTAVKIKETRYRKMKKGRRKMVMANRVTNSVGRKKSYDIVHKAFSQEEALPPQRKHQNQGQRGRRPHWWMIFMT